MDHQPSLAATVAAMEMKLGRELTPEEFKELKKNSPAIASPREVHQQTSPTYGGRNTREQIDLDKMDLEKARKRDRSKFDEAMKERQK